MKQLRLTTIILLMTLSLSAQEGIKQQISQNLDKWHLAASNADYDAYMGLMTNSAVFIGTAAEEHWQLDAFKAFAKPYFDKGKAWDFKAVERHVYVYKDLSMAWFDELLDTWMGLARGSGVMKLEDNQWKVEHYVLSVTVPNSKMNATVALKKEEDTALLKQFQTQP